VREMCDGTPRRCDVGEEKHGQDESADEEHDAAWYRRE
jgi:hypothetical protein